MYLAIKSTLWDLFPAWEDRAIDAAFREMLWASQGCTSRTHLFDSIDLRLPASKLGSCMLFAKLHLCLERLSAFYMTILLIYWGNHWLHHMQGLEYLLATGEH